MEKVETEINAAGENAVTSQGREPYKLVDLLTLLCEVVG
ncbi:hypothetical protein SAMN05720487_107103 [Fibrobacter sp. UWT2]|nr:hypothetical protein SAMN05720487_107103 [Fibrobacter sp. UWT2]